MLRLSEEFLKEKLQIVIADPVGVCWGLRSSADGKGPGLPIVIFGGDHADVPLEKEGGAVIADIAIEDRISMVLDLSHFRKGEQVSFMAAFAERLYHKNRNPLHLLLDEADMFAPQRPMPGEQRMLGAIEDLVRRGRARGIGVTLVTQRAAVLNKNVLTQLEVLVTMRTISPQDQDAIEAWVKAHGTDEQRKEMMGSLASLPIGTAWFWSPGWLDIFKKVKVSRRITFDSSSTPKIGGKIVAPKTMAEVDLEELRKRMAATIERAKSEDPRELKKKIGDLQRQLTMVGKGKQPAAIQTPCNHAQEIAALKRQNSEINIEYQSLLKVIELLPDVSMKALGKAHETIVSLAGNVKEKKFEAITISPSPGVRDTKRERPASLAPALISKAAPEDNIESSDRPITKLRQRILDALIALEKMGLIEAARPAVASVVGLAHDGGYFRDNVSALRVMGLLDYADNGNICLTEAGRLSSNSTVNISSIGDLHKLMFSILTNLQRKILEIIIDKYPNEISRSSVSSVIGLTSDAGYFRDNISRLHTLKFVEYLPGGQLKASDLLFPDGLQ